MKTKILMALLAGTALLAACKNSGKYEVANTNPVAKEAQDSVKLVKTADMRLKVKSVQKTAGQISKLTSDCGGMVMHHDMLSNIINNQDILLSNDSIKKLTVYSATAEMTVKIPSEVIEPFMDSLNHLGMFVDSRKMDVEDRTLDYLATKLKAKNRDESVGLRKHIKLTQRVADSILLLKDDVVDRKMSNLRTNEAAKFSTLTLALYQNNTVKAEMVANDNLSDYNSSLSVRVGSAFSKGWFFFSELVIGLLHLWAFILTGLVLWLAIVLYRRKRKLIRQPELSNHAEL